MDPGGHTVSDLDFLDDLDDAGGYIPTGTGIRRHTLSAPSPIIGASGLTAGERKQRSRPLAARPRRDETWRTGAACAGYPVDWWVPDNPDAGIRGKPIPGPSDQARAICAACPVAAACLEYAITWREEGFWGGLTDHERRKLRARTGTAA